MSARDYARHSERKRAHQPYSALHTFHAAFLHQSLRHGTVALDIGGARRRREPADALPQKDDQSSVTLHIAISSTIAIPR
jgi:hypothetical protein